jgi:hypothetical protein
MCSFPLKAQRSTNPAKSKVLAIHASSFEEEVEHVLSATISPAEICGPEENSCSFSVNSPTHFVVESNRGNIQIVNGQGVEVGSWSLESVEKSPVEIDINMSSTYGQVDKLLKLKITIFDIEQLPDQITAKKGEISALDSQRKNVSSKLGELRTKVCEPDCTTISV